MRIPTRCVGALIVVPFTAALLAPRALEAQAESSLFEVRGGTATFDVGTNIPAVEVHGTSKQLDATVHVGQNGGGMTLTAIEARVPVRSLTTGLGLRDEHMRRYVFTTASGLTPDVQFIGGQGECVSQAKQHNCSVHGELTIRGTTRPVVLNLRVVPNGPTWRTVGDVTIKLSDYSIPLPSQLGVTTRDEVRVHLDFVARPAAYPKGTTGGDR